MQRLGRFFTSVSSQLLGGGSPPHTSSSEDVTPSTSFLTTRDPISDVDQHFNFLTCSQLRSEKDNRLNLLDLKDWGTNRVSDPIEFFQPIFPHQHRFTWQRPNENEAECSKYEDGMLSLPNSFKDTSEDVDWQAWNSYLAADSSLSSEHTTGNVFSTILETSAMEVEEEGVAEHMDTSSPSPQPSNLVPNLSPCLSPSVSSCSFDSRDLTSSPSTSIEDTDITPTYKKRGVIWKPKVDEETDRKRTMNRVAAERYRERKRKEKQKIHKMYCELEQRNKDLKTKEEELRKEVDKMKKEMSSFALL